MSQILNPIRALLASAAGVGIGVLLAKGYRLLPLLLVGGAALLIGLCFIVGKSNLSKRPELGSLLMESGYALSLLAVAIAGGLLFWLIAAKSPAKGAAALSRQTFSSLVSALTVFAGAMSIDLNAWNPVKHAIKTTFTGEFVGRLDPDGRDAVRAVGNEDYGALHPGEKVSGWGWQARRLRAKQIARALKPEAIKKHEDLVSAGTSNAKSGTTSAKSIAAVITSETVIAQIRNELRRQTGHDIEAAKLSDLIKSSVLRSNAP
jgi:hypothetical protein